MHESDEGNQMTTETEDTTYNTESDDGSESISDDADMDWPRRKQEIKNQLTDEGWTIGGRVKKFRCGMICKMT